MQAIRKLCFGVRLSRGFQLVKLPVMTIARLLRPHTRRPGPRRCGLTLIDTVITVLIIGILSAVAAPKLADTLHRYRAESAAKRIKADLGWVRQHAISSSSAQTVQFVPASDNYTISGLDDLNHGGQVYAVDLTEYPYNATLVSASLGADSDVQFDRYGQPDSGGTITVQCGSFQQTVTIDLDTGKATIP